MPGLVPGIHAFASKTAERRGWHANSGLPEFARFKKPKSGKPDLGDKPGHDEKRSIFRRLEIP